MIQSILSTVNRRDVFEAQISAMKLEDLRFINSLLFDARDAFSLEELVARVQQSKFGVSTGEMAPAAAVRVTIKQELRKKRNVRRQQKKSRYLSPGLEKRFRGSSSMDGCLMVIQGPIAICFRCLQI